MFTIASRQYPLSARQMFFHVTWVYDKKGFRLCVSYDPSLSLSLFRFVRANIARSWIAPLWNITVALSSCSYYFARGKIFGGAYDRGFNIPTVLLCVQCRCNGRFVESIDLEVHGGKGLHQYQAGYAQKMCGIVTLFKRNRRNCLFYSQLRTYSITQI